MESAPAPETPAGKGLPFGFAKQHQVLVDREEQPAVVYCHGEPGLQVLVELQRFLGAGFRLESVSESDFQRRLTLAYQRGNNEAVQMAEDLSADVDLSRLADEIPEAGDLMDAEDDAPIIRLINAILSQAVREQASDIHIETFEDRLSIRYRIDGVLAEVLSPKRMLAPLLVSRLKVMAKLDIAEKRVPQDGRISVRIAGHAVDIRMSTIPSAHGERVVLRLLDKQAGQLQLEQLNMNEQVFGAYQRALHSPHGIILVTGPTGSGKTTTLYAGLSHINQSSRNILTIEDPIEYMLPGVGQTQVNTKVDMTFARGLRAILRQDPDVVMVGEIRDLETAEIAVQASLTGHLVLSTLHTNTAIGAVTRLQDMGIEPFLLSSSLIAVMAQRLVRLLCPDCKEAHAPIDSELEMLRVGPADAAGVAAGVTLYRATGCERCNYSGYRGRTGIYELIEVDDTLRLMIHEGASEQAMLGEARKHYPGIQEDGRRRILAGQTSLEEVLRVTAVS
ncbi:type II secretion system ATPase GspE [Parahaliea mediterranea]|uniref:Type II secretion system protein E n=1 Tax=Parahaliea mediterranea TaxID=651086 RepID=A0A939DBY8_9GAMM|nr:type II secretion system ATPase GspE [Parahaliea mediterranea]